MNKVLKSGDSGEAVGGLQKRLAVAGFAVSSSEKGVFGKSTFESVQEFQKSRGLTADGICGHETWSALVEAGWSLGDRLLYLRQPFLRGEDVLELQKNLGKLGFDPGWVDGIFGPDTKAALENFQGNMAITADGVCGPISLGTLFKVVSKTGSRSVSGIKERERLKKMAGSVLAGRKIALGQSVEMDVLIGSLEKNLKQSSAKVLRVENLAASRQAEVANNFNADLYLGLRLGNTLGAAYFAVEGFESIGGKMLAELVLKHLSPLFSVSAEDILPVPMRTAVLKETRMPSVLCSLPSAKMDIERTALLSAAFAEAVRLWVMDPLLLNES